MKTKLINGLGWLGAACFAISAAPQAYQSYVTHSSEGISGLFLLLWLLGELSMLTYVLATTRQGPLLFNYLLNLVFLCVIGYYWL